MRSKNERMVQVKVKRRVEIQEKRSRGPNHLYRVL